MTIKAAKRNVAARPVSDCADFPVPSATPAIPYPAGKVGIIMNSVSSMTGATTEELVAQTGWQRHSVLGALSRLMSRGFLIQLEQQDSRKVYRLGAVGE